MKNISINNYYDVVIIGGGIIGLSSAYFSTSRGLRTLIIDQYGIQNSINSSKGIERMFRLMQDNEFEARLAESSLSLWMQLQLATKNQLLCMDELIFFGHRDAPMTTEGNIRQVKKTMDRMGMPYKYLASPDAIHKYFPVFNRMALANDYVGLVQAASASINVQEASKTFLCEAKKTGNLHVLENVNVVDISFHNNLVTGHSYDIHTEGNRKSSLIHGKHLIICPGIWADTVLNPLGLKQNKNWRIWQMNYAYWTLKKSYPKIPVWFEFGNIDASDNGTFYGFPSLNFSPKMNNTVKISADYTYDVFKKTSEITKEVNSQLIKEISEHVNFLLDSEVIDSSDFKDAGTCFYSMSPDSKLVIGRIPTEPCSQLFYPGASMCIMESGRAFKYAPLFGRVLVELAIDGQSNYQKDLDVFSPVREGIFDASDAAIN
ncbi:FAD-dependent oxidoreductase [Salmonella enterica]|nr:FAD-dependent oxidoreductase [Salmonella enterica]